MDAARGRFEGVSRVVRFNWHFHAIGLVALLVAMGVALAGAAPWRPYALLVCIMTGYALVAPLLATHWAYDRSGLYRLKWLDGRDGGTVLNIHTGYDEATPFIRAKLPGSVLTVCDLHDPAKYTAVSVRRARRLFPPAPGTVQATADQLPFPDGEFDTVVALLAVHELRNETDLATLLRELARTTRDDGHLYVTEHLRDGWNFMAYSVGFLHFLPRKRWMKVFRLAGLRVGSEIRTTPLITTFVLAKDGSTASIGR